MIHVLGSEGNEDGELVLRDIDYVHFFSDGAPQHMKNVHVHRDLRPLSKRLGLKWMIWNYFVACHGKNVCDGEGGHFIHAVTNEQLRLQQDWDEDGSKLHDGRLPIPDARAIDKFMNSDACDFLCVPHTDRESDHPIRKRFCRYLPRVKRGAVVDALRIPYVRCGVYQVSTDCPRGYIKYRRLPHYSCEHCLAGNFDKCPLSFAGEWTLHRFA